MIICSTYTEHSFPHKCGKETKQTRTKRNNPCQPFRKNFSCHIRRASHSAHVTPSTHRPLNQVREELKDEKILCEKNKTPNSVNHRLIS